MAHAKRLNRPIAEAPYACGRHKFPASLIERCAFGKLPEERVVRPFLAVAILALACVPGTLASAQPVEPGQEGQLAALLPPRPGARICFARTYDAAHLQNHPHQKVRSMSFHLAYYRHQPDAYYPRGQRNYYFDLRARLRTGPEMRSLGECISQDDGRNIACMVECDGGGILVRQTGKQGQLMIDLAATGGIRMTTSCDDEESVELLPGRDDKRFLLTQLPADRCPAYDDW